MNIKLTRITTFGLLTLLVMMTVASAVTNNEIQYTNLYETPETWCKNLQVHVSGANISSNNYYLQKCAESPTKNKWYCNCKEDNEFDIVFVNRKTDTHSYVIDIVSGKNSVRKIVSSNKFLEQTTEKEQETTTTQNNVVLARISSLEQKVKQLQQEQQETKTPEIVQETIVQNIENKYNDTKLQQRIQELEEKKTMKPITGWLLLLLMILIGVGGLWLAKSIKT